MESADGTPGRRRRVAALVPRPTLPYYSGYTYYFQVRSSIFGGLSGGIMGLGSMVFKKGLGASPALIALLAMLAALPCLFTPFWSRFLQRFNLRRAIIALALLANAPLLFIALTGLPGVYVAVMFLSAIFGSAFLPLRNNILERNYRAGIRGRAFGYTEAFSVVVGLAGSQLAGVLLDAHPGAYRYIFPVGGVCGFVSMLFFARMKIRRADRITGQFEKTPRHGVARTLRESVRDIFRILKENPLFRRYERNFFLYGLGLLITEPVIVIFADNDLNASYAFYAVARLVIPPLVQMIFLPVWGRLMDRLGASKTAGLSYSLLVVWALILAASALTLSEVLFLLSFTVFGVAMSGVSIVWHLGSMEFANRAGSGEAGDFMAVHNMLVGVRGGIAPWIGVGALMLFGPHAAFILACGFFAAASILMFRLGRAVARFLAQKAGSAPAE